MLFYDNFSIYKPNHNKPFWKIQRENCFEEREEKRKAKHLKRIEWWTTPEEEEKKEQFLFIFLNSQNQAWRKLMEFLIIF